MQATRQTRLVAHVTRFDAALSNDPAAIAALTTLAGDDPAAAEALCVALWIGAAAGTLTPDALGGMEEAAAIWRATEARSMAALRAASQGEGRLARQAARDLRRSCEAARAGRLAAMASWAEIADAPPGPGAMEQNAAHILTRGGAMAAGRAGGAAAQVALGRLIDAADAAMDAALRAADAETEEADAPAAWARAAVDGPDGAAAFHTIDDRAED